MTIKIMKWNGVLALMKSESEDEKCKWRWKVKMKSEILTVIMLQNLNLTCPLEPSNFYMLIGNFELLTVFR